MSGRTIGTVSPIYFPTIQTPFPNGTTHQSAACYCFDLNFQQKFHCTDTLTLFVKVDHSINVPLFYVVNEEGTRISSSYGGTLINPTLDSYYVNIPLSDYCDQRIKIEYVESAIFIQTSIGFSETFYVTSNFECVDCAREITYSGDCIEFDTNYGGGANSPEFEYTLRLDGSLDVVSQESSGDYYKDSSGAYSSCGIEIEEVWRFSISYVPSWMKRKLFYIFNSKRVFIDGLEFIPVSGINTGQSSGFLSELDILLKPANAFATVTGCC